MSYTIGFDDEAEYNLRRLSPYAKGEVNRVLKRLTQGPDRHQDRQLAHADDLWRARAGRRWRVIFAVMPEGHIQIKRIRRRRDAYEGIEHPGPQDVREPEVAYEEQSVPTAAAD